MVDNMKLYNASTGELFESIEEFVKFYNQCYYISTSHWVESEIEKILKNGGETVTDFLNIFAWKTNRINQQKCEESGYDNGNKFYYTVSKREDGKKWDIEITKGKGRATAITRHGPIEENGGKNLYDFLNRALELSNNYSVSPKKDEEIKINKYIGILNELKEYSLEGIGSVYLVTFLYFITRGELPIYDVFAMMALDAIYPDNENSDIKLGSYIKERNLPDKKSDDFASKMFSDKKNKNGKYISVYKTYREKLNRFADDYKKEIGDDSINLNTFRDIDRALWVYGHLFRSQK